MTKKERYGFVISWFKENVPNAETELIFENPYQLLVVVVLSAQCTDKRVNMTTPAFFEKYPTVHHLAQAEYEDVFDIIKSISFPGNKSRHLLGLAKILVEKYNGEIPLTVDQLIELPGVGRKTANVITSVVDNQPNMAVDTHVFRVAARLGLTTNAKNPLAAELQLIKQIPKDLIYIAHH